MEKNSTWRNSPLSPSNWPLDSFTTGASIKVALGGIGITLFTLVVTSVIVRATGVFHTTTAAGGGIRLSPQTPVGPLLLVQFVFYLVIAGYLLWTVPRLARRSWADLGLRAPTWRDVAGGFIGAAVMFLVVAGSAAAIQALSGREQEQAAVKILRSLHDPGTLVLFAAFAIVFAPFVEELAFRGFLFNALLRRTGTVVAALVSGLLFGAAHGELFAIVPLGLGGMVLALTYYRTGCLWSSMIAHATFNSIEVAGVLALNASHAVK